MKGAQFPGWTFDLVKPESMTDEECYSLPATRGTDNNNYPYILTAFKPSPEDLEALNRVELELVYLKVLGTQFAPVALFTVNENGECNPE